MIKAVRICLILILSTMMVLKSTRVQAEPRVVEIELDPVIVLACDEHIDLSLDAAALLSLAAPERPAKARIRALPGARGELTGQLPAIAASGRMVSEITKVLLDVCRLRGLSRGEGFLVEVAAGRRATLRSPDGGSQLRVTSTLARERGRGAWSSRFAIPQSRVRLDRWIAIDVALTLDLSNARASGSYGSPSDGLFVIDVAVP